VLFLYEVDDSLRKTNLKMAHFDARGLPSHICAFKKSETKKYREAVCQLLKCQTKAVAPDGNCFFAAVSTCLAHLPYPLTISAQELRARVAAWLEECKVPINPINPYTTLHHLVIGRKPWRGGEGMLPVHAARVERACVSE
jgi:hypothetical protein